MIVDQVSGPNSKTGMSNDGNSAHEFFSQTHANVIVQCADEKYQASLRLLHLNLSVILCLVSCTKQINGDTFGNLCKETSKIIAVHLPWVDQNFTLHGVLAHAAELIYLNNGWSIGMFSEEPLESNNKFIWQYMERYARTTSPILLLTDVMTRLFEHSNPLQ